MRKRPTDGIVSIALLTLGLVGIASSAHAISWSLPVNGNWSDGTRWDLGRAPIPGDHVVINSAGNYTVTVVIYHPDTQAPLVAGGLVEIPLGQVRIN